MKRILVVYATAGIGHKKASLAIKKALDEMPLEDVEVSLVDALDYTNAFFKWSYLKAYLLMVNRLPLLWGLSYYITDNFYVNLIVSIFRRINNWMNSRPLERYLLAAKPDVIISTHFFASEVVSNLKARGLLGSQLVTVVTDYRLHSWWVSECTDTYVVAGQDTKDDLITRGVSTFRIKVLGIPVEPIFSERVDGDKIVDKIGFKKGTFTILAIGGGFGVGPIEEMAKIVNTVPGNLQMIVICGKNPDLVEKLERLKPGLRIKVEILGFVDNVYEYMAISDVLISKSGGITVSESLVKELPMLIISPILGQETRNSDFLMKHGAGLKIRRLAELKGALEGLIGNRTKIDEMREAIRSIKKPQAARDIAKMAIDACSRNR